MMYNSMGLVDSRRPPMGNSKYRPLTSSAMFKRQPSGHIPLLNADHRPLSNSTNFTQRSVAYSQIKRKKDELDSDSFEYDVPTSNYASVGKQRPQTPVSSSSSLAASKRVKSEAGTAPVKRKLLADDESVRIVTSTIQGMKHWTSKQLPYPILFEVFGKLDSQVTTMPSSSNTRQFSLIDEKDRIECLFAEMDQSFSNIDRDVQLRIICRVEREKNVARCVAIRVADKDEWHERRTNIKQCDVQLNSDDLNAKKSKKNALQSRKSLK